LSDVRLTSVAYIGPKSRTERLRKTKIGTEVAHVTRDLTLPYHSGQAFYRLALRPPAGQMRIPVLTLRL